MKFTKSLATHFFISISLLVSSISLAQTDVAMEAQKAECQKNTSTEWSSSLNKCVGKVEARQTRHEANDCNSSPDMAQREACHKALAEKKTGLSSDTKSLPQGNTTGSMLMNTAYSIVALINHTGSAGKASSCTSKTIFGVTAVAGLASDVYLKYKAKKKVAELAGKYKLDVKNGASDAQVKALEYLKEEQNTVAEIASLEKKRNQLLMMGYAAAGLMAAWELSPYGAANADCQKEEKKDASKETASKETATEDATKLSDKQ